MISLEKIYTDIIKSCEETIFIDPSYDDETDVIFQKEMAASKSAQLAKDLMTEFAEYCRNTAVREGTYGGGFTGNWELRNKQKIVATEQLLEMFLKEKYGE